MCDWSASTELRKTAAVREHTFGKSDGKSLHRAVRQQRLPVIRHQDVLIVIDDQCGFPYPSISHPPALQRRCCSFSRQCYLAQDQAKNSPPI
ncbi:MAG: hypothetical protein OJF50_002517 [Nitrospira sp.]|nr:hypothetical protein [Nitrospira sp.]